MSRLQQIGPKYLFDYRITQRDPPGCKENELVRGEGVRVRSTYRGEIDADLLAAAWTWASSCCERSRSRTFGFDTRVDPMPSTAFQDLIGRLPLTRGLRTPELEGPSSRRFPTNTMGRCYLKLLPERVR